MELLLKIAIVWFSISVFVVATVWYAATIIPLRWPDWWRHVVVDDDPQYAASNPSATTATPPHPATTITSPAGRSPLHAHSLNRDEIL